MPYKDKNKQKEYQRIWIRERRLKYLKGKKCVKCGEKNRKKLEIDHIDWRAKVTHRVWSWAEKRLKEELAKCQILCRVCHKAKTKKDVKEMWEEIRRTNKARWTNGKSSVS